MAALRQCGTEQRDDMRKTDFRLAHDQPHVRQTLPNGDGYRASRIPRTAPRALKQPLRRSSDRTPSASRRESQGRSPTECRSRAKAECRPSRWPSRVDRWRAGRRCPGGLRVGAFTLTSGALGHCVASYWAGTYGQIEIEFLGGNHAKSCRPVNRTQVVPKRAGLGALGRRISTYTSIFRRTIEKIHATPTYFSMKRRT